MVLQPFAAMTLALSAFIVTTQTAFAQPVPALQRQIERMVVTLPLDANTLAAVAMSLGPKVRVPVGLETAPQEFPTGPRERGRLEQRLDLSGLPLGEALRLLFQHTDEYQWSMDGDVLVIGPAKGVLRESMLDRPVKHFSLNDATVTDALEAIHRVFDHGYSIQARGAAGSWPRQRSSTAQSRRDDEVRAAMARTISLRLSDTTVRQVLNAVVASFGDMMWHVTYSGDGPTYGNCQLSFKSHGNWAITAGPPTGGAKK